MTVKDIHSLLADIPDPEIPVITIEELGILRDVAIDGDGVTVTITPTYSGCPAIKMIEDQIKAALHEGGIDKVTVRMAYSPAWTTDWITDAAREKLRIFGIAPPHAASETATLVSIDNIVQCPHCGSYHTQQISHFGSTACKALYRCNECREPFDYFKGI